jgi:hypothetical protein
MLRIPKFRYSSPTNWTLVLLALVGIAIFYVTVNAFNAKRMPRNLVLHKTHILTMLEEHKVPPKIIVEFQNDDQTYYGWIGHATPGKRVFRRWRTRATGADVYVFNQEGVLVDFTKDIEDDSSFKLTWMLLYAYYIVNSNSNSMSIEELRERFLEPAVPVE